MRGEKGDGEFSSQPPSFSLALTATYSTHEFPFFVPCTSTKVKYELQIQIVPISNCLCLGELKTDIEPVKFLLVIFEINHCDHANWWGKKKKAAANTKSYEGFLMLP